MEAEVICIGKAVLGASGAELVRSPQALYKFPASPGELLIYSGEGDCQDTRPWLPLNSLCSQG